VPNALDQATKAADRFAETLTITEVQTASDDEEGDDDQEDEGEEDTDDDA
jgi:hypothetical protein